MPTKKCKIKITYNRGKEQLRLPVLPEGIRISYGSKNESVSIAGLGEVVVMQDRAALQFTFSSFFPAAAYPGIEYNPPPDPKSCVDQLISWKNGDAPVHLIVSGMNINLFCTIEQFEVEEKGGDVGTLYYTVTFKEYRKVGARRIKHPSAEVTDSRIDNASKTKTYTVQKGDCLWNLAVKFYGSGTQYKKIYTANKDIIGGNPNKIQIGQILTIP